MRWAPAFVSATASVLATAFLYRPLPLLCQAGNVCLLIIFLRSKVEINDSSRGGGYTGSVPGSRAGQDGSMRHASSTWGAGSGGESMGAGSRPSSRPSSRQTMLNDSLESEILQGASHYHSLSYTFQRASAHFLCTGLMLLSCTLMAILSLHPLVRDGLFTMCPH